jgi:hypothetical protein
MVIDKFFSEFILPVFNIAAIHGDKEASQAKGGSKPMSFMLKPASEVGRF